MVSKPQNAFSPFQGFTLAELLIALAILGVIATFTIPKILAAQQDQSYNAKAKEAAAMVSTAYQKHLLSGQLSTSSSMMSLSQYMNYLSVDTTSTIDTYQTSTTRACTGWTCLRLHNGAVIRHGGNPFGTTTGGVWFDVDPDGQVTDGTTNGPGKAVQFALRYNGRITTLGVQSGDPAVDPPWFSW